MAIMIIDDLPIYRSLFSLALEFGGYDVITAHGGWQGISYLAHADVDLVICDYTLFDMSCEEFLIRTREQALGAKLPIMVTLSMLDRHAMNVARSHGVSEFLIKCNFEPNELRRRVGKYLSKVVHDHMVESLARQVVRLKPVVDLLQQDRQAGEEGVSPQELTDRLGEQVSRS